MYFQHAEFAAVGVQISDSFFNRFTAGTHNDDNFFGISRADIVHHMVLTTGNLGKLVHFLLHNAFNFFVIRISRFTTLEKDIRVLRRTANDRFFRTQSMLCIERIINAFQHCPQIIIGEQFDFFDFMRRSETVKEMHERHP